MIIESKEINILEGNSFSFFAFGDWGRVGRFLDEFSESLNLFVEKMVERGETKPQFLLALGDNFYPQGIMSCDSNQVDKCWITPFLKFDNLKLIWKAVLGNHDYNSNFQAEIDLTFSDKSQGCWDMPAKNHRFKVNLRKINESVEFFCLDTNGAQLSARRVCPTVEKELFDTVDCLRDALNESKSKVKFVCCHQPIATKGKRHSTIATCLREKQYEFKENVVRGFNLGEVLKEGNVAAIFSGHEHVSQHHALSDKLHQFVAGAPVELGFSGGESNEIEIDWFERTRSFLFCQIIFEENELNNNSNDNNNDDEQKNHDIILIMQFIQVQNHKVLFEKRIKI